MPATSELRAGDATTKTKRAAVYCRISKDRTGQKAGVTRQETDCLGHVERNGYELVGTFVDNDMSAYAGKPRPEFERMVTLIRAGLIDVVVAWHPDRITRSLTELEGVIDLLDTTACGVDTVTAGKWDLSTRSGRTQARLVGVVARDESEAKSERLREMHEHKARKGEYRGSTRHFGYNADGKGLVIVPEEAAVIRDAAQRVLAGETLHSIMRDLNERGIPTVTGRRWRTQTLKRTLTSWTVCGRREHRGEDVGAAMWEPILTRSERDRLHRLLCDPDRSRPAPARVALLAGLVRCGQCGEERKLITKRRGNGRRVYGCPAPSLGGCGGVSIVADGWHNPDAVGLDDVIREAVIEAIDSERFDEITGKPGDEPDSVETELTEIEGELEALADDFGHRRISRREWMAARAPLEEGRDRARAKLAASARTSAVAPFIGRPGALRAAWPHLSLDQRKAIVSGVVTKVVVMPTGSRGPVFDTDRIRIEWRA